MSLSSPGACFYIVKNGRFIFVLFLLRLSVLVSTVHGSTAYFQNPISLETSSANHFQVIGYWNHMYTLPYGYTQIPSPTNYYVMERQMLPSVEYSSSYVVGPPPNPDPTMYMHPPVLETKKIEEEPYINTFKSTVSKYLTIGYPAEKESKEENENEESTSSERQNEQNLNSSGQFGNNEKKSPELKLPLSSALSKNGVNKVSEEIVGISVRQDKSRSVVNISGSDEPKLQVKKFRISDKARETEKVYISHNSVKNILPPKQNVSKNVGEKIQKEYLKMFVDKSGENLDETEQEVHLSVSASNNTGLPTEQFIHENRNTSRNYNKFSQESEYDESSDENGDENSDEASNESSDEISAETNDLVDQIPTPSGKNNSFHAEFSLTTDLNERRYLYNFAQPHSQNKVSDSKAELLQAEVKRYIYNFTEMKPHIRVPKSNPKPKDVKPYGMRLRHKNQDSKTDYEEEDPDKVVVQHYVYNFANILNQNHSTQPISKHEKKIENTTHFLYNFTDLKSKPRIELKINEKNLLLDNIPAASFVQNIQIAKTKDKMVNFRDPDNDNGASRSSSLTHMNNFESKKFVETRKLSRNRQESKETYMPPESENEDNVNDSDEELSLFPTFLIPSVDEETPENQNSSQSITQSGILDENEVPPTGLDDEASDLPPFPSIETDNNDEIAISTIPIITSDATMKSESGNGVSPVNSNTNGGGRFTTTTTTSPITISSSNETDEDLFPDDPFSDLPPLPQSSLTPAMLSLENNPSPVLPMVNGSLSSAHDENTTYNGDEIDQPTFLIPEEEPDDRLTPVQMVDQNSSKTPQTEPTITAQAQMPIDYPAQETGTLKPIITHGQLTSPLWLQEVVLKALDKGGSFQQVFAINVGSIAINLRNGTEFVQVWEALLPKPLVNLQIGTPMAIHDATGSSNSPESSNIQKNVKDAFNKELFTTRLNRTDATQEELSMTTLKPTKNITTDRVPMNTSTGSSSTQSNNRISSTSPRVKYPIDPRSLDVTSGFDFDVRIPYQKKV